MIFSAPMVRAILDGSKTQTRAESKRAWKVRNKAKIKAQWRDYYKRTKATLSAKHKAWVAKNRDKVNARQRVLRKTSASRATANAYSRKRWRSDPNFRLRSLIRRRINYLVSGQRKASVALLGCPIDDFRIYIESKWESGMSWENYGTHWEIDHELPCAIFDLTKADQQRRCFHFSNLQPLWKLDNRKKGAKVLCVKEV